MLLFTIDEICHSAEGTYLSCAYDPERSMLPALAEALSQHARCVRCAAQPPPSVVPCSCKREPPDSFSAFFDFRVAPDRWRDILEALWKKDRRRISSRNTYRLRKEALEESVEPAYTENDIACLRKIQNDACYYCGSSIRTTFHVEHLDPLARGGSNGFSNIMLACPSCNTAKGVLSERQYWKKLERRVSPARFSRLRNAAKDMKRAKRHCYRKTVACASACPVETANKKGERTPPAVLGEPLE